jgi:hypothetical protein
MLSIKGKINLWRRRIKLFYRKFQIWVRPRVFNLLGKRYVLPKWDAIKFQDDGSVEVGCRDVTLKGGYSNIRPNLILEYKRAKGIISKISHFPERVEG